MKDGQVKTETIKTETHEIFDDKAAPDESKMDQGALKPNMIEMNNNFI